MKAPLLHSIDWPVFIDQHDMHFNTLPRNWQEAPHFGNAMVGSMLYQVQNTIRLQIFRADVHDHRDESFGWTAYSRPRLMIGHFSLQPVGKLIDCSWRKHLWDAQLTGTIRTTAGQITIRHFTHAVDMAIVTELGATDGEKGCFWTWHPASAQTTRPGYPANAKEREAFANRYGEHYKQSLRPPAPNPPGRSETRGEVSLWIQNLLAGGQYATAWAEAGHNGTRMHIATIANSFPDASAAETADQDINRFLSLDHKTWLKAHHDWWHDYYPRSFVTLPNKELESLYWSTVYRYGCTSRTGRYHVDTSGLWFQGGPWPYTTNDWNTQAAHWGVYAANRLEQGEEIVDRLVRFGDNLIEAVHPAKWREDSAYLSLATAGDLAGSRAGDMRYYDLVGCLPWLLHNAWWQYRYSMDDDLLRETVFPLLRRAVNLYLHLSEEDEHGTLHLKPTYSPETGTYRDAHFDLALFKWGCHTLIKCCKRLKINDPKLPRWQQVIDKLVDFSTDEKGFMLAGDQTAPDNHRHLSHLLMIYPLYLVNIDQHSSVYVLVRSAEIAAAGSGAEEDGNLRRLQAMVQAHAALISTAIREGDQALDGLERLHGELAANGLWTAPDNPCIESALAPMNIIQDMLIQSWSDPAAEEPGPIRVFPAVPSAWRNVEFHDLRAEGGFLVSAKRQARRTRWVKITSLAGEPCRLRHGIKGQWRVQGDAAHTLEEVSDGLFQIDMQAGQSVTFEKID